MREILFRGKHVKNGEWLKGSLIIDERGNYYIGKYIEQKGKCAYYCSMRRNGKTLNRFIGIGFAFVIPETVGQFTGLYDKNGKKIFEGDIINCYTLSKVRDYENAVVRWNEVLLCFMAGRNSLYGGHAADIYEVIGNIHDNPELMEGAK